MATTEPSWYYDQITQLHPQLSSQNIQFVSEGMGISIANRNSIVRIDFVDDKPIELHPVVEIRADLFGERNLEATL